MAYEAVLEGTSNLGSRLKWHERVKQLLEKAYTHFFTQEKTVAPPAVFFQDLSAPDQEKLAKKVQEIRNRPSPIKTSVFEVEDVVVTQADLMNFKANSLNGLLTTRVKAVYEDRVILTDSMFPASQSHYYAKLNSLLSIYSLRILAQADIQLIQGLKPINQASDSDNINKN